MSIAPSSLPDPAPVVEPDSGAHSASAGEQPLILVAGADETGRNRISRTFEKQGYRTLEAESQRAVERAVQAGGVDLIVLEGRVAGGVLGLCQRLAWSQRAPIILLSDQTDLTDRVIALEVGADDLIGCPFDDRELLARARALLRRSHRQGPAETPAAAGCDGSLFIHTRVLVGPTGQRIYLAPTQFALLRMFAECPGRLVTMTDALEDAGTYGFSSSQLRTIVARLRRSLVAAGFARNTVATIRSEGYALDASVRIRVSDEDVWSRATRVRPNGPAAAH